MTTCLLLSSDLIFSSRIQQAAHHADVECVVARDEATTLAAMAGHPSLVFVDLEAMGEQSNPIIQSARKAWPNVRIVAFGPHVQTDLLDAAIQAGADLVLPRSAFVQQLPSLLTHNG